MRIFEASAIYMRSYATHGAQCGVTTSHNTCGGNFIRDYDISFRLVLWHVNLGYRIEEMLLWQS